MGISLHGPILESFQDAEYRRVIAAMKQERVPGIFVNNQGEHVTHRKLIVELVKDGRLPALYPHREHVELGGLMSYGPSTRAMFHGAAGQIDQILKGGKPNDMPIQQSPKLELVINLNTAKELGIALPTTLLARADELIEYLFNGSKHVVCCTCSGPLLALGVLAPVDRDRARNCTYFGQKEPNASGRTQLKRARINPESQQALAIHQRTWSATSELAPAAHDGAARCFVVVVDSALEVDEN